MVTGDHTKNSRRAPRTAGGPSSPPFLAVLVFRLSSTPGPDERPWKRTARRPPGRCRDPVGVVPWLGTVSNRFWLRPKWIFGHLLCLFLVLVFIWCGFWQLRRLHEKQHR